MKSVENQIHISYVDVLKYYYEKSKVAGWRTPALFVMRFIILASRIIEPLFIAKIISLATASEIDNELIWIYVLGIVATSLVNFIGRRLVEHWIVKAQIDSSVSIAQDAFGYIHRHSATFFSNNMTGALLKKVKDGVREFGTLYDTFVFQLITPIGVTLGSILILASKNWQLGLLMGVWTVIYVIFQIYMYREKGVKEEIALKSESHRSGYLADTFSNNSTISQMGSVGYEESVHTPKLADRADKEADNRLYGNIIYGITGLMMNGLFVGGLVLLLKLRESGTVDIALIVLFLLYVTDVLQQLRGIGNIFKGLVTSLEQGKEFLYLLRVPHDISNLPGAQDADRGDPSVQLDAINFSYEGKKENNDIRDISLTIQPYEHIGLVGESGAGKSTLVKLLLRLYDPQAGSIKIGGTDIRNYSIDSLRSSISYVPQEPILFHRSIRENILYGKPDATEEEFVEATKRARAYDFIQNLPEGFDALVGERGVKLSGGQRQRIAIARAILHDADIIILDEATSALDSVTEYLIQEAMSEVMEGKTAIVIAHRLSTVKKLDRLIVLDSGKIIEEGRHEELISLGGTYSKMVELQSNF